jgi:nitrous oxidase accessory protein NosD
MPGRAGADDPTPVSADSFSQGYPMKSAFAAALLALACLSPASPAHAAESYDACTGTISALPAAINAPGTWCLKQNLATSAANIAAISINVDNVTLDCNGFRIDGSNAGVATLSKGIRAIGRRGVTVRNCGVRGFQWGMALIGEGSSDHLVEHNRFSDNTFVGIWVEGDHSLVRDNQVIQTGGSTATPHAYGIYARYIVDVADNTVSGISRTDAVNGNVIGIYTHDNTGGTVSGNRIHGLYKSGTSPVRGIYNYQSTRVTVMRNNLAGDLSTGSVGITCTNSTSRAKDNAIGGFVTGLAACGDAGRNDVSI